MNNAVLSPSTRVKERKKAVSLDAKKARAGWLFVLPFVVGFALVYLPMLIDSIWLSFCSTNSTNGFTTKFIGLTNYREALGGVGYGDFIGNLQSGMLQLVFDIPAIVIFSLFMAVMLNQKMFGRAAFRAIFFIPVILSTGIIATLDATNVILQNQQSGGGFDSGAGEQGAETTTTGIVSQADMTRLFSSMSVGQGLVTWVTRAVNNIYNLINRSGVQMLIFLAGLQSISPAIYESSSIDGATSWEAFWKITFPMISPMILVNLVYTVIDSFTGSKSGTVMGLIVSAFSKSPSVSSAMAWMYFLLVILVLAILSGVMSALVFYQRRD